VSILEKEKKPVEIEALVNGMKYFVNRLIKYNISLKEINDKKKDRNTLTFGSEELLPMLEADLKASLRVRFMFNREGSYLLKRSKRN